MNKRSLKDRIIEVCLDPQYTTEYFDDAMKMLIFERGIKVIRNMIENKEKLNQDQRGIYRHE